MKDTPTMNGPDHYQAAEKLLHLSADFATEAQVHATLALAAATYDAACIARQTAQDPAPAAMSDMLREALEAWDEATS